MLKFLDEKFLMFVAAGGAFLMGDWKEAIAVLVLFWIGEQFEERAVDKARDNIKDLMNIRPDYVNVLASEGGQNPALAGAFAAEQNPALPGALIQADPAGIQVGEIIYVKAGEKVPLDGRLLAIADSDGVWISMDDTDVFESSDQSVSAKLDMAALTGESKLREARIGDEILSGSINQSATNREILDGKPTGMLKIEVTKCFGESTVSKILDMVENAAEKKSKSEAFITRFARVYTPTVCGLALLVAVIPPLVSGLALGMGFNWQTWIYRALTFLIISCPCALVISIPLTFFAGIAGASKAGVLVKGSNYLEALSRAKYVAFDKTGTLTVGDLENDRLKDGVPETMSELKKLGVKLTCMLTGDTKEIADAIASEAGVDKVYSELLPQDKVSVIEELIEAKEATGTKNQKDPKSKEVVCYVGDGINDAPVLMRADVGIAMGAMGTDAAVEAADIVLMDDDPMKIAKAIKVSKKTMKIAYENIVFSIGVKVACLILSALGITGMWLAIFADTGVMILAVLNAIRTYN